MSADVPTVSIGLPVFNGANYLEAALDSILAQTFTDFELIICDNASTDATPEICRRYAARDGRVTYHRQPRNLGAAANYDMAYRLSRGRYFRWHAHDDLIAPEYLERTVEVLENDPGCVMVHCRTIAIDSDDDRIGDGFYRETFVASDDPATRLAGCMYPLRMYNAAFFGLIRRDVMERTPLHGRYYASDVVFVGSLAMLGRCRTVPAVLNSRRVHDQSFLRANPRRADQVEWLTATRPRLPVLSSYRILVGYLDALERSGLTGRSRRNVRWVICRGMLRPVLRELTWPIRYGRRKLGLLARRSLRG